MDDAFFVFQTPEYLHLLWLLPGLAIGYVYAVKARRRAQKRFAEPAQFARLSEPRAPFRRAAQAGLAGAAGLCIILALARPAWNPHPETRPAKGRSVVFLLDVSKSMLAADLVPNRLERAKLAIGDCLERIKGDRIALVAFAGSAKLLCPLTADYDFFRYALQDARPESVERGGTMLGDALRKIDNLLFSQSKDGTGVDLLLITDGGDTERGDESFAVEAAKKMGAKGMRLVIIGLGDESQGQRIPVANADGGKAFMQYQGREVWDKLHSHLLRQMAAATPGGVYLNAGTGAFDLGEIYTAIVTAAEKHAQAPRTTIRYEEKFQLFLAAAACMLAAALFIRDC